MPEGDSVFQLTHRLQFMVGRRILRSDFRVPRYAHVDLAGRTVERVWCHGKNLFMDCGDWTIHTHLKMEGKWQCLLRGGRGQNRQRFIRPAYRARIILELDGAPEYQDPIMLVGFDLGLVRVLNARETDEFLRHAGPDILAQNWDYEEAQRRIEARPERSIGAALLDQSNVAGIGNEYRAEVLFICGYHPETPVRDVDVARVLQQSRDLLWANRWEPLRVSTGVKSIGQNRYVFGRYAQPCRRCGSAIARGVLGGPDAGGDEGELERITWWCPVCQPRERAVSPSSS